MESKDQLIETVIAGIQERKGKRIVTVDMSEIESASTQYFVICEGTSTTQVSAIADSVRKYVQETIDIKPFGYDGYQNAQWIIIDYGHILVHVMIPEQREYYRLEQLWHDAKLAEIADLD